MLDVVQYYTSKYNNVFLGLEIPSDQQSELNQVLAGSNDFSFIHPIIRHLAYEEMLKTLRGLNKNITIRAIDAREEQVGRDTVMYRNIMLALSSKQHDKIIVLTGNNHTIKDIKWHKDVQSQEQFLAGKIIMSGGNPCSIRQLFTKPNGNPMFIKNDTESANTKAMEAIQHTNHSDEMTGDLVCDAIIEWR